MFLPNQWNLIVALFLILLLPHFSVAQDLCDSGKYGAHPACNDCEKGKFQLAPGQTKCNNCRGGQYQEQKGSIFCKKCDAGTISGGNDVPIESCVSCGLGQYQAEFGATVCQNCPKGYHGLASDTEEYGTRCARCPIGTYLNVDGQMNITVCKDCTKGRYNNAKGRTDPDHVVPCDACPLGRWSDIVKSGDEGNCVECLAGFYGTLEAADHVSTCAACAKGTFGTSAGVGAASDDNKPCQDCPAGWENEQQGQSFCLLCMAGKHAGITTSGITGKSRYMCQNCRPGRYEAQMGSPFPKCGVAEQGTYVVGQGTEVIQVPAGFRTHDCHFFCDGTKGCQAEVCLSNPTKCNAGCQRAKMCDAGQYGENPPSHRCVLCPAGYSSLQGLMTCSVCAPGEYQNFVGEKKCKRCPKGWMQPESRQTECIQCDVGTYAPSLGSLACTACDEGTFTNTTGTASCKECPSGYNQPDSQQLSCETCGQGSYTSGQSGAKQCDPIPIDENLDSPMFVSLIPVGRGSADLVLTYELTRAQADNQRVRGLLLEWSTQTNLADRTAAEKHPDWRMVVDDFSESEDDSNYQVAPPLRRSFVFKGHSHENAPLWRYPIVVRGALLKGDGATGVWTVENTPTTISSDCKEMSGVQQYLRTHPHDDTCLPPLDLLLSSSNGTNAPRCLPCPSGGSCNSPGNRSAEDLEDSMGVGVLLWEVAPLRGWWRVPWAPKRGDSSVGHVDNMTTTSLTSDQPPPWFHKCPYEEACLGLTPDVTFGPSGWSGDKSLVETNWNCTQQFPTTQCLNGTEGPLCSVCSDGFTRIQGECTRCYRFVTRAIMVMVVVVVLLGAALKARQKMRSLKSNALNAVRDVGRILLVLVNMAQIITSIPVLIHVPWPNNVVELIERFEIVNFDLAAITGAACSNSFDFYTRFQVMASLPLIILLVAIGTYVLESRKLATHGNKEGIFSCFASIFDMITNVDDMHISSEAAEEKRLKEAAENREIELQQCYLDLFKVIDVDGSGTISSSEMFDLLRLLGYAGSEADCRINEGFTTKLIQNIGGSKYANKISREQFMSEISSGDLATRIHKMLKRGGDPKDISEILLEWNARRKLMSYSFSWAMHLMMLLHTPISRKVFQFFDCQEIGSGEYSRSFLRVDFSIPCAESGINVDSYSSFMPAVMLTLLFFTILLPLGSAAFLFYKRNSLYTPTVLVSIGWMYQRLRRGAEWWEIHEILRKLLLCGVIVFFPSEPALRASLALMICIVSQSLLNYFEPHRNKLVFWTEQLGMSVVVLLYSFAIVLRADIPDEERTDLGEVFIAVILLIIVGSIGMATASVMWVREQMVLDSQTRKKFGKTIMKRAWNSYSAQRDVGRVEDGHEESSAKRQKETERMQAKGKDRLARRLERRNSTKPTAEPTKREEPTKKVVDRSTVKVVPVGSVTPAAASGGFASTAMMKKRLKVSKMTYTEVMEKVANTYRDAPTSAADLFETLDTKKNGLVRCRDFKTLVRDIAGVAFTKQLLLETWKNVAKGKKEITKEDLNSWIQLCVEKTDEKLDEIWGDSD